MKNYVKPQIVLEQFEVEDVIMESGLFQGITNLNIQQQEDFGSIVFDD